PAALVMWLAEAMADLARWTTGVAVVFALVPLTIWTSAALGSTAAVLSLVLIARARSLALVKSAARSAVLPGGGRSDMSPAKIVVLVVALMLLPGLAWAATPDSRRLEGRLPDNAPVVSIDQPRGTVLDALTALAKQTGWSLVVTAPESATTRPLT